MAIKNIKHYVNENVLNANVEAINKWLDVSPIGCKERTLKMFKRNFYINKLIELDNSSLNVVQV